MSQIPLKLDKPLLQGNRTKRESKMMWNYRIYKYTKTTPEGDTLAPDAEPVYCIQESYYNKNNELCARTEGYELLVQAETDQDAIDSLTHALTHMLSDLKKYPEPLVDFEDWAESGWNTEEEDAHE